jgi:hypothetical protein
VNRPYHEDRYPDTLSRDLPRAFKRQHNEARTLLAKALLDSSYVWRRDFAKPDPRWQIFRIVGNEREKEGRSHAEQNDTETSLQALSLTVRPIESHSNAACAPLNGVLDSYNLRIFRWSVGCDIWLRFPTFPNFRRARRPVEVRSEFGDCSGPASFSKSHSSRARAARLRCNVSLS